MLLYKCWSFCYWPILLIRNNSRYRNCCSWFEYFAVITAEPTTSSPFWNHDTSSIYNYIIFYNGFTIKLRAVSLRTKYLGMSVTLQLLDIENIEVSEYPFKENKNTLKNIEVLLYTHFYNTSLNVLRPNFLNICNLPISHFPNIRKIRVKVGPKTNYFSYIMSSCTDSIVVFNNFFSLIFNQPRDKQNSARDFVLFKYFLNNLLLSVFMQNRLSKLVELLQ